MLQLYRRMVVAACVVGAPRSFVRPYVHGSILTTFRNTGVDVDFFFWLSREDLSNSKGGMYDTYTMSVLRAAVDLFTPKLVVFNGSVPFQRNTQCRLADGSQQLRHDQTNQTTLIRMWETMAVLCFLANRAQTTCAHSRRPEWCMRRSLNSALRVSSERS